jgi:hypothetical protein
MASQPVLATILSKHALFAIKVYRPNEAGRWITRYAGPSPTWLAALPGEPGKFYGYDQGGSWSGKFHWPDDLQADLWIRLLRKGLITFGHIWCYGSPSLPGKKAVFVFDNMESGPDGGQHNFNWYGLVDEDELYPFYRCRP